MIKRLSDFIWSCPAPVLLLSLFLCFTLQTRGIQRKIWKGIRLSLSTEKNGSKSISSLSSLTTTLAATLGTGNIIGLSLAVALGGPGAVFWCWITGILGMAASYAEAFICTEYKKPGIIGGPMDVLDRVLKRRNLGIIYATGIIICSFFTSATIQSRAISDAVSFSSGTPCIVCGIILSLLVLLTLSGESNLVHRICLKLVPVMASLFLTGIVLILIKNIEQVPQAVKLIITSAFSPTKCLVGSGSYAAGSALRHGISRGIFTNEAGLGTAAIPATETDNSSETQGLITMSATFWDTVVLCGITGIAIVCCMLSAPDAFNTASPEDYIVCSFGMLGKTGELCLNLSVIIFAFATLIGWAHFGEMACKWFNNRLLIKSYPYLYAIMCTVGTYRNISSLFLLSDLSSIILLVCNAFMLISLRKTVKPPINTV
ncbi:MAG: amino acid carrier protein [Lachnospiraceae bacterium]